MQAKLDPRLITVGIEVNGLLKTYDQQLQISVTGTKYANANQDECEIKLFNLDKATQDYILTETTPFNKNRTPKKVFVYAGRESYGTALIFSGNVASSYVTQPPDIEIKLKCLVGNFQKGNIIARSQPGYTPLSTISKQVADDLGVNLLFQATDKNISNYNFTGAALKQVDAIGSMGQISAFIDNDILVVKDIYDPIQNTLTVLNAESGMIGIPEITEQGIKVKFLLDNRTRLGGLLRIQSNVYPAVNGDYVIYKLGFEIASRDTPFYYIAEAKRL